MHWNWTVHGCIRAGQFMWGALELEPAVTVVEADASFLVADGQANVRTLRSTDCGSSRCVQTGGTSVDEEIQAWLRRTHPHKPGKIGGVSACPDELLPPRQDACSGCWR